MVFKGARSLGIIWRNIMGRRQTRRQVFLSANTAQLIFLVPPAVLFTFGAIMRIGSGEWLFPLLFALPIWICIAIVLNWRKTIYPEDHRYFTIKVSDRNPMDYKDIPDAPFTLAQLETNVGMANFIESIMMNQSVVLGDTVANMKTIRDRYSKMTIVSNRVRSKIAKNARIDQITVPVEAWKLMTKDQRDSILRFAAHVNLRRETRIDQYMPPIYRALGV
jgi:hypothetical protein